MSLVSKNDIITAAQLDKFGLSFTADFFMTAFGLKKLNALYDRLTGKHGLDFLDAAFADVRVKYEVEPSEMNNIPSNGPFIIVANHPLGMLDGMMLIRVICERRPDFKVMANFLLQKIEPISQYFIYVDPFEGEDIKGKNIQGIKAAMRHLSDGFSLGIFPAGEVSTFQAGFSDIKDKPWNDSVLKLIKKVSVPVVPVYFHGTNRLVFHLLGKIHPSLRTATIASEMFHKHDDVIKIRIGSTVTQKEQKKFQTAADLGKFLRAKVYALGAALSVKKSFQEKLKIPRRQKQIVDAIAPEILQKEIDQIRHHRLLREKNYLEVFLAPAAEIPNVLREIGRLREVTFRKVGEGTSKSIDLDEFDNYYEHLFLWDSTERKIVGAYRLGKGDEIFAKFGKNGFYTSGFYHFSDSFTTYLKSTIELGRSFVVEEYQKKTFPLFLLWKGIERFLGTHPQYQYLLGTVSISSSYSALSRALLTQFIKRHYYDSKLAGMVKVRKDLEVKTDNEVMNAILDFFPADLKELDKLIAEIEPAHYKVPVLLKKYIRQNARIIGFSIDPQFNDCLDGLMMLDLKNLPEDTVYTEI